MPVLEGMVVKGYNVWFDVHTSEGILSCRPRGRLHLHPRGAHERPGGEEPAATLMTGDRVRVTRLADGQGVIEEVLPRHTCLIRPPIANVDQVLVVFTLREPPLNLGLVDRILVLAAHEGLAAALVINKADLVPQGERSLLEEVAGLYRATGYPVSVVSALQGQGLEAVKPLLDGRVTVLAGPSGAGKSCLMNALSPGLELLTGELSAGLGRGRHTTRHIQLLPLAGGWVADAPGFSRLDLAAMAPESLAGYFPEFSPFEGQCRFRGCSHVTEPDCAVRQAVEAGRLARRRYERYASFLVEVRDRHRPW